MITAFYGPFGDDLVVQVPREDLLELHGVLVTSDGRSDVGDQLLSILETAIAGRTLEHHSVHADQLPLT